MQNNSTIRHHVSAERVHVDNGFFTAADSVLHVYLRDIQGGVLAAFNTPDVSPYTFCAGDPINYSDPTGEVIIFVNGLDKFGAKAAGKEYWTESFINGAKEYFNDNNVIFIPVKHKWYSDAHNRWQKGYIDAQYYINMISNKSNESIKLVTHSMGAAYAEGMATYLSETGYHITNIIHINAFQADDFKSSNKYNSDIITTDYQNTDDWVINRIPFHSSPGFIDGSNYIIREPSGYGICDFDKIHFSPISSGKNFWSKLKNYHSQHVFIFRKNNY